MANTIAYSRLQRGAISASAGMPHPRCSFQVELDDQEAPETRLAARASWRLLREEILPVLDRPKAEIPKLLGVSRQTLYDILEEKHPLTPFMALRLGKLCGNGPDLWLNLQKRYDLHCAEQMFGDRINVSRLTGAPWAAGLSPPPKERPALNALRRPFRASSSALRLS